MQKSTANYVSRRVADPTWPGKGDVRVSRLLSASRRYNDDQFEPSFPSERKAKKHRPRKRPSRR